ncbi:MAG: hypothetical protein RRY36_09365 [Bacteroidaceae bacterium]
MKNDINYKGLTRIGSDYNCADGELSECVNMLTENGATSVIPKFKSISLGILGKIIYVHNTTGSDNYFFIEGSVLKVRKISVTQSICTFNLSIGITGDILNISNIGNTIIITAKNGIFYALYKDSDYKLLNKKPPFTSINFGLKAAGVSKEVALQMSGKYNKDTFKINEDYVDIVTNTTTALINKTIVEDVNSKNLFMYPFLIRYAYRLYDGSLFMHSAPVLMLPSSARAPYVQFIASLQSEINVAQLIIHSCELKYKIQNIGEGLLMWKDIIKSIDIFISEPINSYNQNGKIEYLRCQTQEEKDLYTNDICVCYYEDEGGFHIMKKTYLSPSFAAPLPMRDKNDILKDIKECGIFYKISSIPIEDVVTNDVFKNVDIGKETINTLQVQEIMKDDYISHDCLIAGNNYVYNSRLNLTNVKSVPFKGFDINSMTCFGYNTINNESHIKVDRIHVHIKDISGEIIVKEDEITSISYIGSYFFYPNRNAIKLSIISTRWDSATNSDITVITQIKMNEHKNLNGAVSFKEFSTLDYAGNSVILQSQNNCILHPNKIFTSEVNNPFVFNPNGINTIGTGDIIAISSTTKALSQGQFGQFPLYAFSTDGIWALEVNNVGTYSSKQIIARDVLNNAKSVTQIDGAIVFSTSKGLMIVQGSEVICLSEQLNGKNFNASTLDRVAANELKFEPMIGVISDDMPFNDYIKGAEIGYDYINSRLVIINPIKGYQYLYSFMSKSFTKIYQACEYSYIFNNFPNSYIQDKAFNVYDFSSALDINTVKNRTQGLIITRGLKFDTLGLKTINRIINRGIWDKNLSYVKTAVYGSADGYRYLRLSTLMGKSWKLFRIVLYVNHLPSETLSGTSFDTENRYASKMR